MTASVSPPRRLTGLDGLRGVAALVVVVHHSLLVLPGLPEPYFGGASPKNAAWFVYSPLHLVWAGGEAVHVFFILSGLVLTLPILRSAQFAWRAYYPSRLIRLYLPVVVSVALAFFLATIFVRQQRPGQSIWTAIHNVVYTFRSAAHDALLLRGAGSLSTPLWSLQWEVLFSLLLPIFAAIAVRAGRDSWVLAIGLIALTLVEPAGGWLLYLPMFLLGCIIATRVDSLRSLAERIYEAKHPRLIWWSLLTAAVLGLTCYWWTIPFAPGVLRVVNPFELAAAALFVLLAMYWRGAVALFNTRAVQWLGRVSFSVYLVHEPIVVSLAQIVPPDELWLVPVIGIPLGFFIGWIFFLVVEAPAHRLAQLVSRSLKRTSRPDAQVASVAVLSPNTGPSTTGTSASSAGERVARHGRDEVSVGRQEFDAIVFGDNTRN